MVKRYFVYILTNKSFTLYVGVTSDLTKRIWEHKNGFVEGFTKKYNIHKLIYFEEYSDIRDALEREKQIKAWRREKKITLIKTVNPGFNEITVQ